MEHSECCIRAERQSNKCIPQMKVGFWLFPLLMICDVTVQTMPSLFYISTLVCSEDDQLCFCFQLAYVGISLDMG